MTMLEQIGNPTNDNYQFASGQDIDQFIAQMQAPKQDMHIDEAEGLRQLEEEAANAVQEEKAEKVDVQMKASAARASGRLVASVIDNTLPGIMAFAGKDNDPAPYKADPESRTELEEALTEYMRLKGGDIPPGMMVLILLLTIYGSKVPMMLQHRKINTERQKLEETRKQLDARGRELEQWEEQLKQREHDQRTGSKNDHPAGD